MKLEFSRQIFDKYSSTKFNVKPSSESRVISCGRTDGLTDRTDRQTDMTHLIAAFLNFANELTKSKQRES